MTWFNTTLASEALVLLRVDLGGARVGARYLLSRLLVFIRTVLLEGLSLSQERIKLLLDLVLVRREVVARGAFHILAAVRVVVAHRVVIVVICTLFTTAQDDTGSIV